MRQTHDHHAWLVQRLTALLAMPAEDILAARTIAELGVDSLTVARLTEELRDRTGASLAPTLFYDTATLTDLAAAIAHTSRPMGEAGPTVLPIVLAASFTIEPLLEPLGLLLEHAGLATALSVAPYNQVIQHLLDPDAFASPAAAAVVLLRLEDGFRHADRPPTPLELDARVRQFEDALRVARARTGGPMLVALCPHDPQTAAARADDRLIAALGSIDGVDWLDLRDSAPDGHDPIKARIGHIPYTEAGYAALALDLGRSLHRLLRPPAKVIVTDCDNTLWAGVAAEDGSDGVRIEAGHIALQDFLLRRRAAGQLLAIASKNLEADVWRVFEARTEMRLARGDVSAARIDWEAKADNLRAMAEELDLGLDSFVLIDDSPAECAAVAAALPQVTVVQLPSAPSEFGAFLGSHWAFDTGPATREDRRRAQLYREAGARRRHKATADGVQAYLDSLEVQVDVRPAVEADLARAAQLTVRTNQFNTSTLRRGEADLRPRLDRAQVRLLRIDVRDRFGDFGFAGLVALDWRADTCVVETLLLSCRVLGLRVEEVVLRHLCALAVEAGVARLEIPFRPTARNLRARRFLERLGDGLQGEPPSVAFDPREVDRLLAEPEKAAPAQEGEGSHDRAAHRAGEIVAPSAGLAWIASLGQDGHALQRAMAARVRPRPALTSPFIAPRTPLQIEIARIWRQVLRLDRVGAHDDFYALGGDSLAGAELIARMQDLGLREDIGLAILESPTVAGLAALIEDADAAPVLVSALASLEAAARLPQDIEDGICTIASRAPPRCAASNYFLTGASGYVGAYLAAELLRDPGVRLVCHVRAADETAGLRRVRGNLERYGLWRQDFETRIEAAPGALDRPRLGLEDALHDRLARETDAVVHCAAHVNFVLPYSHLQTANVDGAVDALRFAMAGRVKPLHFISTLGVLMSGYPRDHVVGEADELDRSEDLPNGYEQTKWVADKLVWRAMQAGYPASIHRLGMLSGLSNSGVYHKLDEFLPSFLKGCLQLGAFPRLDTKIEMAPVDVAARAVARIVARPDAPGRVFHVNHPDPLTDADFVEVIRAYGYRLRYVPWDVWKRELLGGGPRVRENALYPFLDFIRGLQAHQTHIPEMDMGNFLTFAAEDAAACPDQRTLLRRYFDHFIDVGFLAAPAPAPAASAFRAAAE